MCNNQSRTPRAQQCNRTRLFRTGEDPNHESQTPRAHRPNRTRLTQGVNPHSGKLINGTFLGFQQIAVAPNPSNPYSLHLPKIIFVQAETTCAHRLLAQRCTHRIDTLMSVEAESPDSSRSSVKGKFSLQQT